MAKRVFLVVLDSFGIGNAPDAKLFGDEGSNTLAAVCSYSNDAFPNMSKLGLFDIDGHTDLRIVSYLKAQENQPHAMGAYARVRELSKGKDTTIGHWEMAGIISDKPLPTYPNGFPSELLEKLSKAIGRGILCNKPYSGTDVIRDYGKQHMQSGDIIVYTSADSVLQIAAHEDIVPIEELYSICEKARALCTGDNALGRVIARPFIGTPEDGFTRTERRHDYSLLPPSSTMLNSLSSLGLSVISIGKIKDVFANSGITQSIVAKNNSAGIEALISTLDMDFNGLCFVNLVDFDMKYGHRNDVAGYCNALHEWDNALNTILPKMKEDDLLLITGDHGCDPSTPSTDHSRENVPLLIYGDGYRTPQNLGELSGFTNISTIVLNALLSRSYTKAYEPATMSHKLDEANIMSYVDMTNLKVTATGDDIELLVKNAIASNAASVCVQPCFVALASQAAKGKLNICTVIGFPNGYNTTASKLFEATDACDNGASEIDMVINVAFVKSKRYDLVAQEISALAKAVHSKGAILKVIIECCFLTQDEKLMLCKIVTEANADYIKTSTGFGTSGATLEDVSLMKKNVGTSVRIKAAGGIRTQELAKQMLDAGASRIGASGLK